MSAAGRSIRRQDRLRQTETKAAVAELADALDLGSSDRKVVEVRVLSAARNNDPRWQYRHAGFLVRGVFGD